MERDEVYVPALRSDFKLPPAPQATRADYLDAFKESPLFTCARIVVMQAIGMCRYFAILHRMCLINSYCVLDVYLT